MAVLNNIGCSLSSLTSVLIKTTGLFTKPSSLLRKTRVLEAFHSTRSLHIANVVSCGCHGNKAISDSVVKQNGVRDDGLACMILSVRHCSSKQFQAPSPYKKPGPRRYGYRPNFYMGGLLPRLKTNKPLPMPEYKPKDAWTNKVARRGQNDYIDLLGDGSLHPANIYKAPPWLLGYRGNEMQRLLRQMSYEGEKLKLLYPTRHHMIIKRIKYLYKRFNHKRSRRN